MTIRKIIRTSQPQTPYLDKSNHFTNGLKGVWVPTSRTNIVTGTPVTMGSDVTLSSSEDLPAWSFTGTTNSYINTNTLAGSLGISGTSSKTILAVINQKSTSTNNKHVFGMGTGGTNGADFLLRINIVGDTYGQLWGADIVSNNGNSYLGRTSKAIIALSFESTTQTVTLRAGSSKVSGTYALNTSNSNIDIGRWVYNNSNYVGKVYGCFAWNKVLSDAEYANFYNNPWQIFQPLSKPIYTPNQDIVLPTKAYPTKDLSKGLWTGFSPDNVNNVLSDKLDEPASDTSDYIYTDYPSTSEFELSETEFPGSGGYQLSYNASGASAAVITVKLRQGMTEIAQWQHPLTLADTTYTQTLTPEQIALVVAGPVVVTLDVN